MIFIIVCIYISVRKLINLKFGTTLDFFYLSTLPKLLAWNLKLDCINEICKYHKSIVFDMVKIYLFFKYINFETHSNEKLINKKYLKII